MFDQHEIVFAANAPSESMLPGIEALKSVGTKALREIEELFPDITKADNLPKAARLLPRGKEQRQLIARHAKAGLPLLS